ncbi:hypothetical protein TRFO_19195 [Tritrichomonas foetus]|uniref:E3 ubiquitin-protein ligase n=1 Tax=Tritrichomonas foetus TaxID=1144522 RepID=A0A1J4KJK3_9EUKA|nr:hypothetical protein TRFO_19195 [Tritrichomonas foetus]|eukprot:OHT11387.1 hypothetical protein TRFO_19195 [Tritrichomonas foetus]
MMLKEQIFAFFQQPQADEDAENFLNSCLCQKSDMDFDSFKKYLIDIQPSVNCIANWTKRELIGRCKDCMMNSSCCVCIKCLINGPHIRENHRVSVQFGYTGSCDCGLPFAWSPAGFCKDHKCDIKNPQDFIPEKIRLHISLVFTILEEFLTDQVNNHTYVNFCSIFNYLSKVPTLGPGVRRLSSITFTNEHFVTLLIDNIYDFDSEMAESFKCFLSSYASEEEFNTNFGKLYLPQMTTVLHESLQRARTRVNILDIPPLVGPNCLFRLSFHFFQDNAFMNNHIDFENFFDVSFNELFRIMKTNPSVSEFTNMTPFFNEFWILRLLINFYIKQKMTEKLKRLLILIASLYSQVEGYMPPFHFGIPHNDVSYDIISHITFPMLECYKKFFNKIEYIPEIVEIYSDFILSNKIQNISLISVLHCMMIETLKNCHKPKMKTEFDQFIINNPKFKLLLSNFEQNCQNLRKENLDENLNTNQNESKNERINTNLIECLNDVYLNATQLPLKIITHGLLLSFDLFDKRKYCDDVIFFFKFFQHHYYVNIEFPSLFSIIQTMFSFVTNKNQFLKMIENELNIFNSEIESKSQRMFLYVSFVSALLMDRNCFYRRKVNICQLIIMTLRKVWPDCSNETISHYLNPIEPETILRKMDDTLFENDWHLILPFIDPNELLTKFLPQIMNIKSNETDNDENDESEENAVKILYPFPEFEDIPNLDLRKCMESTYLYSILYDVLHDRNCYITIQYVLNLFIILFSNSQNNQNKNDCDEMIKAINVDELCEKIPVNFRVFCEIKIEYKRCGSYLSLIDLIEKVGPIGLYVLKQVHYTKNEFENNSNQKSKEEISHFKSTITNFLINKTIEFEKHYTPMTLNEENMFPNNNISQEQIKYLYIYLYQSTVPDFLLHHDFQRSLKRYFVAATCGHLRESNFDANLLFCPHCSKSTSFLLPRLDLGYDNLSFVSQLNRLIDIVHNKRNIIRLLKAMIVILDYRTRSKPELINDKTIYILYRNLFLVSTILLDQGWEKLLGNFKSKIGQFIVEVIFGKHKDFLQIFVTVFGETTDYETLKRVELINKFYLGENQPSIIDYDDYFSYNNLVHKYSNIQKSFNHAQPFNFDRQLHLPNIYEDEIPENINIIQNNQNHNKQKNTDKLELMQLKPLEFVTLPYNYLEIINEPFNEKISLVNGEENILCLITGDKLTRIYQQTRNRIPLDLTFQPVLIMSGRRATSVGFWRYNYFTFADPIYKNRKGQPDKGFTNGDVLFLDSESYLDLIDKFISGEGYLFKNGERAEAI